MSFPMKTPAGPAPTTEYRPPMQSGKENPISDAEVIARLTERTGIFQRRNSEYAIMRAAFDGDFNQETSTSLTTPGSELNLMKKISYNLINVTTRRYMDEMTAPVLLQFLSRAESDREHGLAERKTKLAEEIWHENHMSLKVVEAAFYQGHLDKAVFRVRPAPHMKYKVAIDLVVPESYYPAPTSNRWDLVRDVVEAWRPHPQGYLIDPSGKLVAQPLLLQGAMIDYTDRFHFRQVDVTAGKARVKIPHKWGLVPYVEVQNIPVPHRNRGQGDSDQALGLNRYLNELITDQANVLTYMAHPIIVIRGSRVGHTQLPTGPQAVWELERDGAAEILTWAGAPPTFEAQIIRIMQAIEDATGISSPAFGREIPSGVSGETIRSILAGFNTRIGAKQSFMGMALVELFEVAFRILECDFPNEEFECAAGTIRPAEFEGYYRNMAVFQPQNEAVKVFAEIQKMDKGIQSKYTTMRNTGIRYPGDEMKRIRDEQRFEMMKQMASNGTLAGANGQPISDTFRHADAMLRGKPIPVKNPMSQSFGSGVDTNAIQKELGASDPGTLADALGGDKAAALQRAGSPSQLEAQDIEERLQELDPQGPVFLAGPVVDQGFTKGNFMVIVKDPEDIAQVKAALGDLAGRADVKTQDELPNKGAAFTRLRVGKRYTDAR